MVQDIASSMRQRGGIGPYAGWGWQPQQTAPTQNIFDFDKNTASTQRNVSKVGRKGGVWGDAWVDPYAKDIVGWLWSSSSSLPQFLSNVAEPYVTAGGQKIREWLGKPRLTEQQIQQMKQEGPVFENPLANIGNKESSVYKGAELVGDISQVLTPTGGAKLLSTLPGINKVTQGIKKVPLLNKLASLGTKGVTDTAKYTALSEGRLPTKEELTAGGLLNVWLWVGGNLISKGIQKVTSGIKQLPEKLMSSSIKLTPSQIKNISKMNVAWTSPEKWLLKKKVSGSLEQMADKTEQIANQSYNTLNKKVASVQGTFKSEPTKEALNLIQEKMQNVPMLGGTEIASQFKNINKLIDKANNNKLSLQDMLQTKRYMDKMLNIYKRSGDVKDNITSQSLSQMRDKLKTQIEKIWTNKWVPNIKELSKDIQVATQINEGLQQSINRESKNKMFWLTDWILAGGAGWVALSSDDPVKTLGQFGWLLLTKKVIENPAVKTRLAQYLQNLLPKEQEMLKNAIANKTGISKELKDKIRRIFTQVWIDTTNDWNSD